MKGLDPVDRSWMSADGLTLHARDYPAAGGAARLPVICLHGLTRNSRDFEELAPWISARARRVLAVDVRGRGLSDRDAAADYRVPAYAADVAGLADALGIGKALFVGTSMGGMITMELATVRPALVGGAIVNDIGPVLGEAGLARIAGYAGKGGPLDSWDAAAAYLRDQNQHALPRYRADDWLAMARRMFRSEGGSVMADYDPAIARTFGGPLIADPWTRWETLAEGRPILLLRGALSDLLDADVAETMARDRPSVTLCTVPDVGHAPMLDEPAALTAIGDFLDVTP